ncbi:MAG: DUF1013 domain-containing protein [Alphaproteobacteria bacterium]|nr:DUF1013 domain-containing protein [Alphaproteobacteria bacterium]
MAHPLMPKATAVWLIDNTALTFEQIADFCELHVLEIQAIADGEVNGGIQGFDPILNGQITREELERCQKDSSARLEMATNNLPKPASKTKGPRYIPVAKRGDKPDAIAWLLKHHHELKDVQIARLIGTTKDTINKVRDRSHWNSPQIQARHPVILGLCSQKDLDAAVEKSGGTQVAVEAQIQSVDELPDRIRTNF